MFDLVVLAISAAVVVGSFTVVASIFLSVAYVVSRYIIGWIYGRNSPSD